jgi:hippurate hydrolase
VDFVKGVQEIEQGYPPEIIRVVRFGKMDSGSVRNAVSDHTRLLGTLRTFQDEIFFEILDRLKRLAEEISKATGCKVEVSTSQGYPAVMNPPEIASRVHAAGINYPELPRPAMTTEDFAWYQRYLPGMFFFLGTGETPALHNGNFNFDEAILESGADFFEKLALRYR